MTQQSGEQYTEEQKQLRAEIEKKHGKTPEQLYKEREKRIRDAINLQEPDRVPTSLRFTYFPGTYLGIPKAAAYYDPATWSKGVIRTILDFDPDMSQSYAGMGSGAVSDILKPTQSRWPGGPLPENTAHQAIDVETMMEDEYELLLNDPTDFYIRKMLPRTYDALKPLANLPPLGERSMMLGMMTPMFASEDFKAMGRALIAAGEAQEKWTKEAGTPLAVMMDKLCLVPNGHMGGAGGAPFDGISDRYRGMHGAMLDMFRHPDELLAVLDKMLQQRLKAAVPADPNAKGNPKRLFMALHRGADGFMSDQQFEKFYWPGLKAAMMKSIELGYIPMPFCEGKYDDRIEYFLEMPKGKVVVHLDLTDMFRAKEILKDHCCLMGNLPASLLQLGTPNDVDEYCKKLIEVCGKDGGLILTHGSSIDEAKPENLHAMIESTRKYNPK
ncbi:uroporphyrinogen decarboxylase family protein [Chloroflexota bacterium]